MIDPRRRLLLRGRVAQAADAEVAAPPRPPWSLQPDSAFSERCTRCGDCVRACRRGLLATGDGGFPVLSFAQQGCNACGDCSRACPTGAIGTVTSGPPFAWRVAVAAHCLAQQRIECRLCADACDARALRFMPAPGGIAQLRIDAERCTGCGECVAPCPVGAISLRLPAE